MYEGLFGGIFRGGFFKAKSPANFPVWVYGLPYRIKKSLCHGYNLATLVNTHRERERDRQTDRHTDT